MVVIRYKPSLTHDYFFNCNLNDYNTIKGKYLTAYYSNPNKINIDSYYHNVVILSTNNYNWKLHKNYCELLSRKNTDISQLLNYIMKDNVST